MAETAEKTEYSVEQLKQMLAKTEKKERKQREAKKKQYELDRDASIIEMFDLGLEAHNLLLKLKNLCHTKMNHQSLKLAEYGAIRGNSKGGFSITTNNGNIRIRRRRDTQPVWDERSIKAVDLLKDFLGDVVKKRAEKEYTLLMSFLEKNQDGDLEYAKVMLLLQNEHNYDDPRWVEGLALLKESYQIHLKGYGYEIQSKDASGKFQTLKLNFSSIDTTETEGEESSAD